MIEENKKNFFRTLAALFCLAAMFAACNNESDDPEIALQQVKFDISVEVEGQTRAVKTEWTDDDKIFLVPSENIDDYSITYSNGKWTPSDTFYKVIADYWAVHLASASWGAVWTSYEEAAVSSGVIQLAPETEDGRETLVAKEGTTVSFDPDASVWTIKLVLGQPADYCKVTVEGLSDEKYHLQFSSAVTTANLQYKYADGAFVLTHNNVSRDAREVYYTTHWSAIYGNHLAGKGYLEDGNMSYFFTHNYIAEGLITFILMDESELNPDTTKMFVKFVDGYMPWASGNSMKIKGPVNLYMDISDGWSDDDANGWVRVQ